MLRVLYLVCAALCFAASLGGTALSIVPDSPNHVAGVSAPVAVNLSNWSDSKLWMSSDDYTRGGAWDAGFRADHVLISRAGLSLHLDTTPCPSDCSGKPYAVGNLVSKARYGYGFYQVDMQVPKGNGLLSGFDTFANSAPNGPEELDDYITVSVLGKNTKELRLDYSGKGIEAEPFTVNLGFDASSAIHRYGFAWTPASIEWFVDGKSVHRVNASSENPIPNTASVIDLYLQTAGDPGAWFGPFTYAAPVNVIFSSASFTPTAATSESAITPTPGATTTPSPGHVQ
jgi:endo-1,3-1,4-beta-glycanase ExoK